MKKLLTYKLRSSTIFYYIFYISNNKNFQFINNVLYSLTLMFLFKYFYFDKKSITFVSLSGLITIFFQIISKFNNF